MQQKDEQMKQLDDLKSRLLLERYSTIILLIAEGAALTHPEI